MSSRLSIKRRRREDGYTEEVTADKYFTSYGDTSVHILMLRDLPRVESYLGAIMHQKSFFQGKVVLDVGSGSGVLAMLAAKYGEAARVYAVEACPEMAKLAEMNIEKNGLSDRIKVIASPIESVTLPEKVDVLISEWMGFYLLHESMLDSVLYARDKFLNVGGQMLPAKAQMHAALIQMDHMNKWGQYYGLDMSIMGACELSDACSAPLVDSTIDADQVLSNVVTFKDFDLCKCTLEDIRAFQSTLQFQIQREGSVAAVAIWFDTEFSVPNSTECVVLRTGPEAPPTHWKQTVVMLGSFTPVQVGAQLGVILGFQQNKDNHRLYDISVTTL